MWDGADRVRELEQALEQSSREREQSFAAERAALHSKLAAAEQARSEESRRLEADSQAKAADFTQVSSNEESRCHYVWRDM
jgi:hypothetical protein